MTSFTATALVAASVGDTTATPGPSRARQTLSMAFKQRGASATPPDDPEALYRTLAGRGGAPKALWVHQGDVLREWHGNHLESRDVALELPTGAGKTLVGGLIAEWRRSAHRQRVAYLCPTNQLAVQTADNLESYGLPVVRLIGKVRDWSSADRIRYSSAGAVAVSVYSHLFNSNPALSDAELLVLDDAHAAESYVAGPWSVRVDRDDAAYLSLVALLKPALDPMVAQHLMSDLPDAQLSSGVYLASPTGVSAVASELEATLRAVANTSGISNEAKHAARMIRGHVDRCMVYVSYRSVQIRPLISPTGAHEPFEAAKQRVYMSATLGAGGELERAFGRTGISRIPAPKGWDRQGTGRRFFCFPELATDLSQSVAATDGWVADTIAKLGKAVVLTPEQRIAEIFKQRRVPSNASVFHASDIEHDLDAFALAEGGVLVLTNRYDGIDLPDQACRLVILQSLPARGDLQERFLHGSLGALEVLQERLRARFVQGAGRATRNSGDYAVVVILGSDLTSFCSRRDVQGALHPEVQAEVRFGLEQSLSMTSTDIDENIDSFLSHDETWANVEAEITNDRDACVRLDPPGAIELQRSAPLEVQAQLAAWQGDWRRALEKAKGVVDALRGGQAPQRYAALWNYIASCWATRLWNETGDESLRQASALYLEAARAASRGTTWLARSSAHADAPNRSGENPDPLDTSAALAIQASFARIGRAKSFDADVVLHRQGIGGTEPGAFERALAYMGSLAGASDVVSDSGADAAPDAAWVFTDISWVTWEAKSDAKPEGDLGANDVRQAGSHLRFLASARGEPIPSGSIGIVVTPQAGVTPAATAVSEAHLFRVDTDFALRLFDQLVRAWRSLRARYSSDPALEDILGALFDQGTLPTQWQALAMANPVRTR